MAAVTIHGRTRQQRYSSYADWGYIARCAEAGIAPVVHAAPQHLWEAGYSGMGEARAAAAWGVGGDAGVCASLKACSEAMGGGEGAGSGGRGGGFTQELPLRPPPLQVIGNGDILSWQDWYRHLEGGEGGAGGGSSSSGSSSSSSSSGGSSARLATCMLARGALIKPWLPVEIKERRDWDISARERLDLLRDYTAYGLEHWGSDAQGVAKTRKFLLEWLSFLHRYVPVGLLERTPQLMGDHAPAYYGRNDLETLMASNAAEDWVKITELLLGPVPPGFRFVAKHKSSGSAKADAEG